jgi:hypothetical protein
MMVWALAEQYQLMVMRQQFMAGRHPCAIHLPPLPPRACSYQQHRMLVSAHVFSLWPR